MAFQIRKKCLVIDHPRSLILTAQSAAGARPIRKGPSVDEDDPWDLITAKMRAVAGPCPGADAAHSLFAAVKMAYSTKYAAPLTNPRVNLAR
jgi:hypothetical protein